MKTAEKQPMLMWTQCIIT